MQSRHPLLCRRLLAVLPPVLGLVFLPLLIGALLYGQPQWHRAIYLTQARIFPQRYNRCYYPNEPWFYRLSPPRHYSGTWYDYYPNGRLRNAAGYRDGERHGTRREWDHRGELIDTDYYEEGFWYPEAVEASVDYNFSWASGALEIEGQYKNGRRHGRFVYIDGEGAVPRVRWYLEGRVVDREEFERLSGEAIPWERTAREVIDPVEMLERGDPDALDR